MCFVFMKVKAGFVEYVINNLRDVEEVKEAYPVTGGIDIIVKIEVKDVQDISKVALKKIHTIDGVERTATHIVTPL